MIAQTGKEVCRICDKCGGFPKRGNKAPQRICRSNAVRRRNGERNGIVTSRICNILRSSAKISREGEGVVLNADLIGLTELGNCAVKRRAIDTEIFGEFTVPELHKRG